MSIKTERQKGFTLVEMLVVLFIISMLVALITPNLIGARDRAKDAAKREEMTSLKNALRLYYNDYKSYPDAATPGTTEPPIAALNSGNYLPSTSAGVMVGIGYSKVDADSFYLLYQQNSTAGDEDDTSQTNCGLPVIQGRFAVCVK